MSERWKVVIIGGGFGGLSAAQHLNSNLVDVTLIDRRNYHLFQPLLYQVATGSLSAGEVASPLRSVLSRQKTTRVWLGTVVDIDPDSKRVFLADGAIVPYDSLIVAAGSQTSYFGRNEWQEWAPGMKSVEEATTIRHKILYAFEVAERISDPKQRRAWLTFVIVGAGPTGVELSGAIAEIARQTLKNDFRSIKPEESQIILLDGAPRVLMPFPEGLAGKASRSLAKLGVEVRCGAMVKNVDKGSLAVIGRAAAVADVFGLHISGFLAWLVWAFIHVTYLVSFQSRILVFIQWAIQDLTFSRGARLITGSAPTDFNFSKELSEIKREPVNAPRLLL